MTQVAEVTQTDRPSLAHLSRALDVAAHVIASLAVDGIEPAAEHLQGYRQARDAFWAAARGFEVRVSALAPPRPTAPS